MTQVLFDRLKSNLAQCINDGTIYFVTDSNGNFTRIALGDGSKSHVVGIGPKMDDATKQELMSKLGLTISSDMSTIQLGKLANHNGVSSQKVVTYERTGLGTDTREISTVGYVKQYMKTAQAMVYAGLFNAQTKEITDYNNAIISPSEEGNVTFDYLLNGNEGETLLTSGMSFIVGTAGDLEGYTGISVYGGETKVEVGDMIIITDVTQKESEEGGSTYNEASILVIQNTNSKIADGAVTTAKIADAAVTTSKLSTDIQSLISNLSKTATFAGIATPTTNPGTPDGHVFYIAKGKGTYTNFGDINVTEDEVVILYYDTVWHKEATGIASQKKLYGLEDEIGIINCNRLEGYDYKSSFTLQTAISAVPVDKRYVAKGITYLDEIGEIHLALFNSAAYGSGWLNINNWILLDKEFIDFVYNRRFFTPVTTRGYIDFNNDQGKLIVSSTLYYTVNKSLKSINAGSYDIDLSAFTANYGFLVIDSDSKLSFKGITQIDKTDFVIASFAKSGNTIDTICHSVVPYRINGVDISNNKLSEQISELDNKLKDTDIIAKNMKKSNVVQSVEGSSYFNTVEYSAKKGDTLSISLNGSDGLINGYGLLEVDGKVRLGGIMVGENIIVELPNDITYVQFQRAASGVIGSGDIELVVDMPLSIDNRIENNSRKIEELELKNQVSADIQAAASAYEFYIRAREEYLRDLYKSSGDKPHWYGVEWIEKRGNDGIAINSDGDESLHSTLPIQNKMKRCVKTDIVQYYLNADNSDLKEDGTPAKLYGVDGNVMVEIPEFFYRFEEEIVDGERTMRLKISEQGLDGFIFSPKRYTSAYEATLDRTNNKLVSVCTTLFERNTEDILTEETNYIVGTAISRGTHKTARRSGFTENASNYRGGTNDATLDNETDPISQNYSRNQLGLPIANVNRTQCRSYVDNLNGEFIYQYDTHKVLWMLAMVEFKKKDITKGTDMSIGANVYPDYNSYEAYFSPQGGISCLPCGITNSLGNKTGTVYYRMINVPVKSTGVSSSIVYNRWADVWMPCLSYRGVEHWFGHIYKIADGINILCEGTGTYYEGKEGDSNYEYNDVTYWYQKNPYLTNDGGTDKQKLGTFRYMSGIREIKSILGGSKMHILPIDADVTNYQTHYCDCVEIYHRGGMMYPTFNGRIVSGLFDGANFIVGNNLADNGNPRASDGTRLDNL